MDRRKFLKASGFGALLAVIGLNHLTVFADEQPENHLPNKDSAKSEKPLSLAEWLLSTNKSDLGEEVTNCMRLEFD